MCVVVGVEYKSSKGHIICACRKTGTFMSHLSSTAVKLILSCSIPHVVYTSGCRIAGDGRRAGSDDEQLAGSKTLPPTIVDCPRWIVLQKLLPNVRHKFCKELLQNVKLSFALECSSKLYADVSAIEIVFSC
jgi:hypothetical protein